jgi:hypothetical protein
MDEKDRIANAGDQAVLKIEGAMCVAFQNANIPVDSVAPIIRRMHLRHALSSHLAFISKDHERVGPEFEMYDHEEYMKIVSEETLEKMNKKKH